MEEHEIYNKAIAFWGKQFQTDMMMEEASELIKAILKNRRGQNTDDDIISEMVDCQIMINQMRIIFNNNTTWNFQMKYKLDRLKQRIESAD